jgi:hypothetical protein
MENKRNKIRRMKNLKDLIEQYENDPDFVYLFLNRNENNKDYHDLKEWLEDHNDNWYKHCKQYRQFISPVEVFDNECYKFIEILKFLIERGYINMGDEKNEM